jgi:hypothetical protein
MEQQAQAVEDFDELSDTMIARPLEPNEQKDYDLLRPYVVELQSRVLR